MKKRIFTNLKKQSLSMFWMLCLIFGANMAMAQDTCPTAETLATGAVDECVNTLVSNAAVTNSNPNPTPTCGLWGAGSRDNWFEITVPASGFLDIEVSTAGGLTDWAMSAWSGTCGALTQIECDDDDGPGLFPVLELTGLTPGETIYLSVWEWGTSTTSQFNICAIQRAAPPTFCDFLPALEVNGPATLDICEGEEVDIDPVITGGGAFPEAVASLYFAFNDFASFNLADAATPTIIAPLGGQFIPAMDYANGVLYALDGDVNNLITIDPATGAQSVVGPAATINGEGWTGMSYNEANGTMYATSVVIGASTLYTIDLATGAATPVGSNAQTPIWLAIDNDGDAYFLDLVDDNLYSIDLATAAATNVGPIGFNVNFAQGADFDPQSGLLVAALYLGGGNNEIVVVNTTTGAGTDIGLSLPNGEAAGFALQGGVNNFTYSWSPATGLSCTTCPNPTANPTTTTTYTLMVTDGCGNVGTLMTTVNVNFPTGLGNGDDITCIGNVNASVDADCSLTITADELVSGDLDCPGLFGVDIAGTGSGTIQVGGSSPYQIGDVLDVEVTYPDGSNACWGSITLEDKTAPTITCEDFTLGCNDDTSVAALGQPMVDESCGGITLVSSDVTVNGDCADGFLRQIFRTWTATNVSGMSVSCIQVITVNRQALADVVAPRDFDGFDLPTLSCGDSSDPSVTGRPTVNGEDATQACGLSVDYSDEVSSPCEGTTKIFRTWEIIDWCVPAGGTGANRVEFVQFIKLEDKEGPVVDCPGEINVSTDFDACAATVVIPVPTLSDECASAGSLSYTAALTTADGILIALPSGGYVAQGLPVGKSTIVYTAVDPCGNESFCTTDINVADEVAPAMSCETFRKVSLQNINPNEPTIIFAEAFDDGSYDNCEIATYEVRRMSGCIDFDWTTNGAGLDSDPNGFLNFRDRGTSAFYPAVPFACCDLGNTVMVELRITDIYGNSNSCMVEVEVEDKVNPIVTCPANVTIECLDEIPGYDFLSATESAAFNTPVFAGTPFNPGDFLGYYDGVIDNCGATLYINEGGSLDECSIGTLTRRFQAQDASGNLSTPCTQRISVINSDPFEIVDTECRNYFPISNDTKLDPVGPHSLNDDVEWPCDLELECGIDPTPDNLEAFLPTCSTPTSSAQCKLDARPQLIRNDACDIIAMTYDDFELPIVGNTECRKILRTWTITDHCQFEIDNATGTPLAGFWQYTQLIKIIDNEAPVLNCSPVAGAEDADPVTCDAEVVLTIGSDSNNCEGETLRYTWAIDAFNNGSIDFTGVGNDATNTYPIGEHRIIWSVEDYCGNVGEDCEQLFYVVENTPPNIVALTETDVNLANGLGEVWPSEVEISSFDVCSDIAQSLLVSPSLGDGQTAPPAGSEDGDGAYFTCDDLNGASDATVAVDYWLQDGAGNWSYVTILVNIDDSQGFCDNGAATASVAGTVATEENEMVENTTISVDGSASTMPADVVTGTDGAFAYDLELGQNYSIAAARNDNPLNGVTTYDLVLLGQHLLELNTLDSPYKMIAADVNGSGSITSLDMIALRRLILFIDTELATNTSWRFVDGEYVFPNPTNPFATTFPEVINYNDLAGSQLADFVGVKIGDLNASATANALAAGDTRSSDGELVFNVEDAKVEAGQTYTVDFKAADFNQIAGYQFTLNFDANAVEFVDFKAGALRGLTADNFGFHMLNEGVITTSWNAANALSVSNDDVLFSLTFTAKAATQVSKVLNVAQNSAYTSAEAYNEAAELYDLSINFNTADNALFQNQPNPFRNETVIGFELAEAAAATVTIYDVAGRTIKQYNGDFAKGYNSLTINRSELSGSGVLYYQLETADFSATKKMILVD